MDEERQERYNELINQILDCDRSEEEKILQENDELVGLELLLMMANATDYLKEENELEKAENLERIASKLIHKFGYKSLENMYEEYEKFLMKVLNETSKSNTKTSV
jgi:hypothetical protein